MRKILVVDNDRFMREFLENGLSKEGYEVKTAEDGLSGLDILETYTPDFIFVDLVMPNIDGKRLCKIIRGMERLKHVYIIILSSIVAEENLDISELGANACIAKGPFHEMAKNILSVLEQSESGLLQGLSEEVIGIETSYPLEITREFLSVKKHFESILERMSEGIVEVNSEGRIIYANPNAISIFNLPEEKLLGALFVELFGEDARKGIEARLRAVREKGEAIASGSPVKLNEFQVTLNMVPIESTTVIIINRMDAAVVELKRYKSTVETLTRQIEEQNALLTKRDSLLKGEMENRKKAEEALQEANSRVEDKIREQTIKLTKRNESLKEELANQKGVELALQETCDKLKNQIEEQTVELSKKDTLLKEESENQKKAEEAFKKIRGKLEGQVEEKNKALSEKDVLLTGEIENRMKAEEMLKATHEDLKKKIDEHARQHTKSKELAEKEAQNRKKAEAALSRSEERFNAFVELFPEALFEMDGSGNLTFFNDNGLDRFGYTGEDIKNGLNIYDMVGPMDRQRMKENAKNILQGKKHGPEKYQALKKDGTTFSAMLYSTAILREDKSVGLRGIIIKVADRELTEELLIKTQKEFSPLMKIKFGDQTIEVNEGRKSITMGRDSDNDLVFDGKSASRSHALLINRGDKFFLVDKSKNGTYVHIEGKEAVVVKQEEYLLSGSGIIGLGCKVGPNSKEAIEFSLFS